jgi:hypothetical protein
LILLQKKIISEYKSPTSINTSSINLNYEKMKKTITLLIMVYSITHAISQTITSASLPTVGEAWIEFIDTTANNIILTPPGAGQTWNYTNSFTVNDTSGFILEALSTAPAYMNLSTLFPNANAVVNNNAADSSATLLQTNADGFYFDGVYDQGLIVNPNLGLNINHIDFNPNRLIIPTPFSLNSTRNNTAQFVITASIPFVTTVTVKTSFSQAFEADATGTLSTPFGVFNNVLRIKEFTYTIDSTTYNPPVNPNSVTYSDTTITYSFVHNNSHCLLMTVDIDPVTLQPIGASYYDPVVSVGIEEEANIPVTMYPNPASESFYLNHVRSNSTISIIDITGKEVITKLLSGYDSTIMINTNDMPAGIYILKLNSQKEGTYFVNKFQVVK